MVLTTKLEALADAAGELLRGLVASGEEEVPFELTGPGEHSPFAQYTPMSGRFVREHWAQLAELDAFAEAREELQRAGIAGAYLERLDEPVPPDEARRAEAAAINFLAGLWDGSADFPVDRDRVDAAVAELQGCVIESDDAAELVVPLLGFHMPTARLELGDATIVRADLVEVPDEVRRVDGTRRSAWEPLFVAVVRNAIPLEDGDGAAVSPGAALRDVVRTLRLFKEGGVGLGPYAWARTPGDRWRRLPTGCAHPRAGGYRLAESELGDLAAFARTFSATPVSGVLARAISRFEAGLERSALLEALSDYVLTLRHLLEGGGPADVGLGMRAAALLAEPEDRPEVRRRVERALALEGELMRGELPARDDGAGPLELVTEVEELTRTILRDAVAGGLGSDLRAAADEALLADGLAAGDGAAEVRGATAEWGAIESSEANPAGNPVAPGRAAEDATGIDVSGREAEETTGIDASGSEAEDATGMKENEDESPTRELMDTKNTRAASSRANLPVDEHAERSRANLPVVEHAERSRANLPVVEGPERDQPSDWLSEVDSRGDTLDWPERPEALKILDRRPQERERARRRVRHLFPRPETTDWRVAELHYERRRRTRV